MKAPTRNAVVARTAALVLIPAALLTTAVASHARSAVPGQRVTDTEAATVRGGADNCSNLAQHSCTTDVPNPEDPTTPCRAISYWGNPQTGENPSMWDPTFKQYCGVVSRDTKFCIHGWSHGTLPLPPCSGK